MALAVIINSYFHRIDTGILCIIFRNIPGFFYPVSISLSGIAETISDLLKSNLAVFVVLHSLCFSGRSVLGRQGKAEGVVLIVLRGLTVYCLIGSQSQASFSRIGVFKSRRLAVFITCRNAETSLPAV